jgi:hypothetical protein
MNENLSAARPAALQSSSLLPGKKSNMSKPSRLVVLPGSSQKPVKSLPQHTTQPKRRGGRGRKRNKRTPRNSTLQRSSLLPNLHFAIPTATIDKTDAKAEAAILPKRPDAHAEDKLIAAQQAAESAWKANYYTVRLEKQLANANTQIIDAKQTAETAMNKQKEAKTETDHLSKQLVTTHYQLDAVHKSWQEQQQQLTDHQEQFTELKARLEDTELRFQDVAESLEVQTTELAGERRAKRELEVALAEHRQMYKRAKRKPAEACIKPEVKCDV